MTIDQQAFPPAPKPTQNGNARSAAELEALKADLIAEDDTDRRLRAARLLFDHAIATRDDALAQVVAARMDVDPQIDALLARRIDRLLAISPDGVYSFIRQRLAQGIDDRWVRRLGASALASLRVAVNDGDNETILNWLRLIAREPAAYNLVEVVRNSVIAAHTRAYDDPPFALALTQLAARKSPIALAALLDDPRFCVLLPEDVLTALVSGEGDANALLAVYGGDVLIAALRRGVALRTKTLFTPAAIDHVWGVVVTGNGLAGNANRLLDDLTAAGIGWLAPGAREGWLIAALKHHRDDRFVGWLASLEGAIDARARALLLAASIRKAGRSEADAEVLIAAVLNAEALRLPDAVVTYAALLDGWEWRPSALILGAALARALHQQPEVVLPLLTLRRLLTLVVGEHDETIARLVLRSLTAAVERLEPDEDADLIECLEQMIAETGWSAALRTIVITWWRGFVRGLPIARIARLERGMSDRKPLDDARSIASTVLAFRRLFSKHDAQQFNESVRVAFTILQGFSDSFDPSPKRAVDLDAATMRAEIAARTDGLSKDERQILANDFKELADLILMLADNRRRTRQRWRDDEVSRQLLSGEQEPHNALDALRWFAGYLSGAHDPDND